MGDIAKLVIATLPLQQYLYYDKTSDGWSNIGQYFTVHPEFSKFNLLFSNSVFVRAVYMLCQPKVRVSRPFSPLVSQKTEIGLPPLLPCLKNLKTASTPSPNCQKSYFVGIQLIN